MMAIKLFARNPRQKYSIIEISRKIGRKYAPVHAAVQRLLKKNVLKKQRIGHTDRCSLNPENIAMPCFAEAQRAAEFLKRNADIKIAVDDIGHKLRHHFYALILFGSYAKGTQARSSDVDILLVAESEKAADECERIVSGVSRLSRKPLHAVAMTCNDFIEMAKSKGVNVVNEAIENHVIFSGCEQFYKMLGASDGS